MMQQERTHGSTNVATCSPTALVETVVVLPRGLEALSLDPVVRRVTIRGEARLTLGGPDYANVFALMAHRAERHERRRRTLLREVARAESAVEESAEAAGAAAERLDKLHTHVDALNEGLRDLNEHTAALMIAERSLGDAEAELKIAEAAARRLSDERAALSRAVDDAAARARASDSVGERILPWDEEDLRTRIRRAESSATDARALVAESQALLEQADGTMVKADRCREVLRQAASECQRRLDARTGMDDGSVRSALHSYESAAAGREIDPLAVRLADELAALAQALADAKADGDRQRLREDVEAARERVVTAAAALDEATQLAQRSLPNPEDVAELEAAYHRVSPGTRSLRKRLSRQRSRRGTLDRTVRGRKSKRAVAAQAELDSLLARHGFADFLDYRLHQGRGDDSASRAVQEARAQLACAHAELAALENGGDPTEEERELEQTYAGIRRECVELLGYDPGDHLQEVLRAKPDVPIAVTIPLVTALVESGVETFRHSVDVEARTWLAAFDAEQQACDEVASQLALIEAQLAGLDRVGPSAAEREALKLAVETIVELASDRARHAEQVAELLLRELAARQEALAEGATDRSLARELAGSVTALRWLIRDEEHRIERQHADALQRVERTADEVREVTERLQTTQRNMRTVLGGRADPGSLIAEALQELERGLREAASAHEDAVGTSVRNSEARDALGSAQEKLSLHLSSAPPALPEEPTPMDLVAASRWVANRDDHPAIVLVATRAGTEEVAPEVVDALLELSRDNWVVTTIDVLHAALRGEETPAGVAPAGSAVVLAPRVAALTSLRSSRRRARGRQTRHV